MLTSDSILWFGIHKGKKLSDVPEDYLLKLYFKNIAYGDLKIYINANLDVLNARSSINNKTRLFSKKFYTSRR